MEVGENMTEELISKKELLELTGISYGQLYRWKRKKLLPEEWFIKKSSYTGQETFFPREKILDRLGRIQNMKDDLSLDDLADVFSPNPADIKADWNSLIYKEVVSRETMDIYEKLRGKQEVLTFHGILNVLVLDKLLKSGSMSTEEGSIVINCLEENYEKFQETQCELILVRKMGVAVAILKSPGSLYTDRSSKIVERLNITKCIEEIKVIMD